MRQMANGGATTGAKVKAGPRLELIQAVHEHQSKGTSASNEFQKRFQETYQMARATAEQVVTDALGEPFRSQIMGQQANKYYALEMEKAKGNRYEMRCQIIDAILGSILCDNLADKAMQQVDSMQVSRQTRKLDKLSDHDYKSKVKVYYLKAVWGTMVSLAPDDVLRSAYIIAANQVGEPTRIEEQNKEAVSDIIKSTASDFATPLSHP